MKNYELARFGNAHVLTHKSGKRVTFKSYEDLTRHIYRFHLVKDIEGLDALPHFYRTQIGYKSDPVLIKDVAHHVIQESGLTNPSLIS